MDGHPDRWNTLEVETMTDAPHLLYTSCWTALRCASLRGARSCQLGSLRSQPNDRSLRSLIMQLVTPGHIWSLLVTDSYKYIPGGIVSALAVS